MSDKITRPATNDELRRALGQHVEIVRRTDDGLDVSPAKRSLPPQPTRRDIPLQTREAERPGLRALLDAARRAQAQGGRLRPDDTFVPDTRRTRIAGVNGAVSLRAMLPELIDSDGRIYRTPPAAPSAETRTLGQAAMANSRAVQFGAKLIEIAEARFRGDAAEPVFEDVPTRFNIIQPANLAVVNLTEDAATDAVDGGAGTRDEGAVTASSLPVSTATLDRSATTQRAVRFEVPRSVLRTHNDREIEAEIMMALALGLGRAVDRELLAHIQANAITLPFGVSLLEHFAGKGVRASEVRCVVGTEQFGNTEFVEGQLYNGGIPAEFSPDVHATILGAFDRAAVAVSPELEILVERTAAGALIFTAWADFAPLVPDAGFFYVRDSEGP